MTTKLIRVGLNINRGYKICIRLRYAHNPSTFIPFEQTVDTMLHELSHIVWGPHDANFHALWDELRDEYETLVMKGYSGEGFLSQGNRLGGGRIPPQSELRRLARANAEKRRVLQKGSGHKVGGNPIHQRTDIRQVIADAAERRNRVDKGCASGRADAGRIAEQASQQTFTTKADEDDANDRAIAEALLDLLEEEEAKKMHRTFTSPPPSAGGLAWSPEQGLYAANENTRRDVMSEEEQLKWALQESVKSNLPKSVSDLEDPDSSWKRTSGTLSPPRPEARPAKRSRSHLPTSNVLRFSNPDALHNTNNSGNRSGSKDSPVDLTNQHLAQTSKETDSWTCDVCTCINPLQFLTCDACGVEIPQPRMKVASKPLRKPIANQPAENPGWYCRECATFMEHKWWTCSGCGLMKDTS